MLFKKFIRFIFCHVLFSVKYVNKDIEKNIGKCVVCSNHLCFADPFFLYADMKSLAIMAKAELFKNKFIGSIFSHFGVFPIKRGEKDVKSILHSVNILRDNKAERLLIFPEGTRIRNDKRVKPKVGAAYIALKANVPIFPVRIIKKYPHRKVFTPVTIIYDTPLFIDKERASDKEYLQEISNRLMDNIYNLSENVEKSDKK